MAENLTDQQKQAVYDRGGKLLVSAAAGSGKTKVLVDRLMTYLMDENDPANIDDFLIITFTDAAAAELRSKIVAKLNEKIAENPSNKHLQRQLQRVYLAKISTIHAFCSGVLRENTYRLDLSSDFRLADEKEALELKTSIVERLFNEAYDMSDPDFFAFIDTQGLGRNDRIAPKIVLDIYEKSRCHLNPTKWLEDCVKAADVSKLEDVSETIWGWYLINDLHELLDLLIESMSNCVKMTLGDPDLEKPCKLLQENVDLLADLRNRTTWKEIMAGKDLDFGSLRYKNDADPDFKALIAATRDRCKKLLKAKLANFTESNEKALLDIASTQPAINGIVSMVKDFADAYAKVKKQRRLVDFSDLEHYTLDLLIGKNRDQYTALSDEIGACFREIMVDEYQDTNEVQDCIFNALSRKRKNCFMVGDVKQSIYQFRLADPSIFIEKYNTYRPQDQAVPGEGRKVILSSNFRSLGGVIDAVNDVFTHYMSPKTGGLYYTKDEQLNEGVPKPALHEPGIEFYAIEVAHDRYTEEAAFVANRIKELLDGKHKVRGEDGERPITPDDIVILLRAPGSVGMDYQNALERIGIRCVREKSNDLLKTEEICVLRSLLQCISNPLQDIPLVAAITSRVIGMNADDVAQIRTANFNGSFYDALNQSKLTAAKEFCSLLRNLRRIARNITLTELVDQIITETALDSIYASMVDGDKRLSNIYSFNQLVAEYENNGRGDLERFLEYLDNLEAGKGYSAGDDCSTNAVRIMSIHKSKGLEFPVVFACALSKGFNDEDLYAPVICDSKLGLGLNTADLELRLKYPNVARKAIATKMKASSFSEEMRVLYVALTRAKDRLIMTYSRQKVEKHINGLSLRMRLMPKEMMALDVTSAGDWVLMTAMQRSESRRLFENAMPPHRVSDYKDKWIVDLITEIPETAEATGSDPDIKPTVSQKAVDVIEKTRHSVYPYEAATIAPSKQTATQLKGRYKDQEASEGTAVKRYSNFRKPSFAGTTTDGRMYGNAMHTVMQHIKYRSCTTIDGITAELDRLLNEGYITNDERNMIDAHAVEAFFQSDIGKELLSATQVLREFKFSILDDGLQYGPDLEAEKVLLQGVVDCVMINDDGLTIIDFKTDRVTEETLSDITTMYTQQINVYARAMSRIYQLPVVKTALYYFRLKQFVYV